MPRPSTVQFIAMLRALDRAVGSHGVSHAEVERRLCDWLSEGRRAVDDLREASGEEDRKRLQALVDLKTAVELSGLARTDGRRDRAGGQRIGELVAGKFPSGGMPPRRRVEVCVDVFLAILRDNDPAGYAEGMYGTHRSWREWWLQADQGNPPDLGDRSLTVWGYLDVAPDRLTETAVDDEPADRHLGADTTTGALALLERIRAEADQRVADAHRERDQAVDRARQAAERLEQTRAEAQAEARAEARAEAERQVADARAERDRALDRVRRSRLWSRAALVALAVTLVAAAGAALRPSGSGSSSHTVQFASPAQEVTGSRTLTFPFAHGLPAGKDWTLHVTLNVAPTDPVSACTFGMRITAHVEVGGRALPPFTSRAGETAITHVIHLGKGGGSGLRLVVTRLATDPQCTLRLDPAGTQATART